MFSVRSIFLLVRGVDQTGRALTEPKKKLTELEQAQRNLSASGTRLMFAGAAFASFGAMATMAMMRLLETTSLGQLYLSDFERVFNRLKQGLAEAIMDQFGPTIEGWIKTLDELAKNDTFLKLTGGTAFKLALTLTEIGVQLAVAGVAFKIIAGLAGLLAAAGFTGASAAVMAGGQVGLAFAITTIISMKIAEILWEFMPEAIENYQKDIEAAATKEGLTRVGGMIPIYVDEKGNVVVKGYPTIGNMQNPLTALGRTAGAIGVNIYNYFYGTDKEETIEGLRDSYGILRDQLGNVVP